MITVHENGQVLIVEGAASIAYLDLSKKIILKTYLSSFRLMQSTCLSSHFKKLSTAFCKDGAEKNNLKRQLC